MAIPHSQYDAADFYLSLDTARRQTKSAAAGDPADELAKLKAQLRIWDDDVNRYVLKAENQWQAMVALMRLWVNRPWRSQA